MNIRFLQPAPQFDLGEVVTTPGALAALERQQVLPILLVSKHLHGDWGSVSAEDALANDNALKNGGRLLSSYAIAPDVRIWVITEADHSVTTLLLPSEY